MKKKSSGTPETASLLIELLTEELPPKSLRQLSAAFSGALYDSLKNGDFIEGGSTNEEFATPRRLAVRVSNVRAGQPDQPVLRKGPSVQAGLDSSGKPTQALLGFARSCGVDPEKLERLKEEKGEYFLYRGMRKGEPLAAHLPEMIRGALKRLPVAKVMRWGLEDAQFVRPVHGLLIMHGAKPIRLSASVLGFSGGSNGTQGHRFLGKRALRIRRSDEYEKLLERDGRVIADFGARKERIRGALEKKAAGAKILSDDALLDEVTALVEWPQVYEGTFGDEFLAVPQECLILSMRQHQRYFPLADRKGVLLPRFLIVSNVQASRPGNIVRGNERVLRARLADAKFFYDQDRKQRLETRVPKLSKVVYHNKLGSQLERVERIELLSGRIAHDLDIDPVPPERAARLSKADLLTGMVGEFPELQGVMGRYYARHDGERPEVCDAIEQHYWPRFAGDRLPQGSIASAVALADRLDTLVGIFGIGLAPTGDKDPFALRRLALGVIRILCEHRLPLDVNELLRAAHGNYPKGKLLEGHKHGSVSVPNPMEVGFFLSDRARSYLREAGYATLEVESVLDLAPKPAEYVERLEAVRSFLKLPEAAALAESDKRIRNILNKSGGASVVQSTNVSILQEEAEKELLGTTRLLRQEVESMLKEEKFREALISTARIHRPVARFFDKVLVNVGDEKIRMNRFALLHEVIGLTNRVANISKLAA